jgi:hypothetical protein
VRLNGRLYEAALARLQRRPPAELYHCALEVRAPVGRHVIELAPAWGRGRPPREAIALEGPVGLRWAGALRLFRYQVRCWAGGTIPDVHEAVGGARRLTDDPALAARVLALVPEVPALVWGRDQMRTGDMWNSNSLASWLLVRAGVPIEAAAPPAGGRAPGWDAGIAVARRAVP